MTTIEKSNEIINRAKANNYSHAFISDPDWVTVAELRKKYEVLQGWNNHHLTGYNSQEFGYLIKLK